jgi:hypothetical protein
MSDNSLIAPAESTQEAYSGAGLVEGYFDMINAFKSEGWVDDALGTAGFALEVVGSVLDPFSALLANGLGWAMEYFDPLREMLTGLGGHAGGRLFAERPDRARAAESGPGNMGSEGPRSPA